VPVVGRRSLSKGEALTMRAARAHEDPAAMTSEATLTRMARYVAEVLKRNPELTPLAAARAARLKMRADMTTMAEKREAARREARTAAQPVAPLDEPEQAAS
jgi:hypothetical protein